MLWRIVARTGLNKPFATWRPQDRRQRAVKALYNRHGGEAWGHSLMNLLQGLKGKIELPDELLEAGRMLDKYCIPARYPNGWDEGTPQDCHSDKDSSSAIANSEEEAERIPSAKEALERGLKLAD